MRSLQPLASGLWIWFLIWTVVVAVLWVTGFGESQATEWLERHFLTPEQAAQGATPLLQAPLLALLRLADPLWVVLAAANAYLSLVAERGLSVARRWMLVLLASAFVIGVASAWSRLPLGPIHFTGRLGPRLAMVSLGWVLLWCIAILGARELARLVCPRASHGLLALIAALSVLATDLNLEPVAWKSRAFWLWFTAREYWSADQLGHAPLQNYATWLIGAGVLAYLLRSPEVVRAGGQRPWRGAIVLLLLNALCLGTHLAERLR